MGVKAIVAVPVDSKAACASIEKAKDDGIPFFTIDRAPDGCEVDMTIQSDNYLAGKQAAEAMVALLVEKYGTEKGTVLELQGDLGQNVAQLRGGGFNDVMAKYPEITVIQKPTNWDAAKFSSATLDVASSEELDGIYMHSDCVGIKAVSAALQQVNKLHKTGEEGHIILTGVDGCRDMLQAIRDGYADESSSQPLPDFGVVIADFMEQVMNDETLEAGTVEQAGALWSPAVIEQTSTGFVANLSTTQVTIENVDNPGLWGNQ
jgi:ABC-type sugar transport system substrate-binding protein